MATAVQYWTPPSLSAGEIRIRGLGTYRIRKRVRSICRRCTSGFLQDNLHSGFAAGDCVDIRLVSFIAVQSDFHVVLSRAHQHGMKMAAEIAAMAHVAVIHKNGRALGLDIDA